MHSRQRWRRELDGSSPYTAHLVTQRPLFGCLFEIVETLVLTLIIFLVIQTFVAQPYKVQQQSMEHTLEPEQYVLVDKLTPAFDTYKRGDIVVFTPPADWARRTTRRSSSGSSASAATRSRSGTARSSHRRRPARRAVHLRRRRGRPPQPTTAPVDQETLDDPRRRALPDGRPSLEFGRLADVRAGRVEQVIGRAWLRYWPIDVFGILRDPDLPGMLRQAHEPDAVNPALVGVALAVVIGAVLAGSARNARTAILGLVVMLLAAPAAGGSAGRSAGPCRPPDRSGARGLPPVDRGPRPRIRTGGSLVGWPTESHRGRGGDRRLRQPWPRRAGRGSAARRGRRVRAGRPRGPAGDQRPRRPAHRARPGAAPDAAAHPAADQPRGTPRAMEQVLIGGLVATLGGAMAILAAAARARWRRRFRLSAGANPLALGRDAPAPISSTSR